MPDFLRCTATFFLGLTIGSSTILSGCAASRDKPDADFARLPLEQCPAQDRVLPAGDSEFGQQLIKQISQRVLYPKIAQSAGEAGRVELCIDFKRDGEIRRAVVARSSGFPLLDGAALYSVSVVNAAGSLGDVSSFFLPGQEDVWFRVPVNFNLEGQTVPPLAIDPSQLPRTPEQIAASEAYNKTPEWATYVQRLKASISNSLIYPELSYRAGQEGDVVVWLVIRRDGQLLGARVVRSNCDSALTGIVLMDLGLLTLQPDQLPIPASMPVGELQVQVPIHFEL